MQKEIKMTIEQARLLFAQYPEYRNTILSVFTNEELGITPNWCKSWEELKEISGYYVGTLSSRIIQLKGGCEPEQCSKKFFSKERYAKSALAYSQLSQLVESMNNGWEPDWSDKNECKWTPYYNRLTNTFGVTPFIVINGGHLYFKTHEMALFSIKHHSQLWEDFFMVNN